VVNALYVVAPPCCVCSAKIVRLVSNSKVGVPTNTIIDNAVARCPPARSVGIAGLPITALAHRRRPVSATLTANAGSCYPD
jgi:hypothetical protein